jgi:hypothetical protein
MDKHEKIDEPGYVDLTHFEVRLHLTSLREQQPSVASTVTQRDESGKEKSSEVTTTSNDIETKRWFWSDTEGDQKLFATSGLKPEPESTDLLITSLQVQLDDLQRQRWNIQRVIRGLEIPGEYDLSYTDSRARKKRCAVLKSNLAEVINAEHNIGLRLQRAWRRKEKEDPNNPVGIL